MFDFKKIALVLAAGFASAANAEPIDVIICANCTTTQQFENAASQRAGNSFNGEREYLVVSGVNGTSKVVNIWNVPAGQVPLRVSAPKGTEVRAGETIQIPDEYSVGVYVENSTREARNSSSRIINSWELSNGEKAEIQAIWTLSQGINTMVLPNSDHFESFAGRNHEAVSLAIYSAAVAKSPGWVAGQLQTRLRGLVGDRLKSFFGKSPQYCVIFNNGDSACYELNVRIPSSADLIDGSQKNANGNSLAPGGGGGGGGGLTVVNNPPNIGWSAPGAGGGGGEMWLFCASSGGKIISCWVEILNN